MALADLVFVFGVVAPHFAGTDPVSSLWMGLPALVSVFTLPLIAYGAALLSGRRLLQARSAHRPGRPADLAVVALAVAGFVAYVSPWGLSAITGFMIALD